MTVQSTFTHLPDVTFVEHDTGEIEAKMIRLYEAITKTVLYPGNPERLFITTLAAIIAQRNVEQDYTGKQNLLRYARGPFLDHLGELLGVRRLKPSFASTRFRYSIASPMAYPVLIPQGTRATADARRFWSVDSSCIIPAGETSIVGAGTALTAGLSGNGLVPGQINRLVDPLDVVVTVENITTTTGGSDEEKDDPYRTRIHLAPEKFSTAGPTLAYVYWALSARSDIYDVAVYSPKPGVVHVYVLLAGGIVPDADGPELEDVRKVLSDEKVRPLTDKVLVMPAEPVDLDYEVAYFLTTQEAAFGKQIGQNVKDAVAAYEAWQVGKIGRDINPDELVRGCRAAGSKRIAPFLLARDENGEIIERSPFVFTPLNRSQVARFAPNPNRVVSRGAEDE